MKTALMVLMVGIISILAGCSEAETDNALHFTVNFEENQTLRYKFVSSRDIDLNWDPRKTAKTAGKNTSTKSSEYMEMVVAYKPVKVDRYGVSIIKATCESVKVTRTPPQKTGSQPDAALSFKGKSFEFPIVPSGKIRDYSQIEAVIKQVGEKAFRADTSKGKIKEPDMVRDIIASQWFLWDSISSIPDPIKGVEVGQNWESQLSVPNPMMMRRARDVVYTLDEFRDSEEGQFAVIKSQYCPSKSKPKNWPVPQTGTFKISGSFGFLFKFITNYKLIDLQGTGEELYNLSKGRIETDTQHYKAVFEAASISPLGGKPQVTIDQKFTMELLNNK